MKSENITQQKSYAFALRIVKLRQFLTKQSADPDISKQLLRSGTSIGANVEEAIGAQSKKDFKHKLAIAYKEARETHYWLRLLEDANFIEVSSADSMLHDCEELLKLIGSTLVTLKKSVDTD